MLKFFGSMLPVSTQLDLALNTLTGMVEEINGIYNKALEETDTLQDEIVQAEKELAEVQTQMVRMRRIQAKLEELVS